MQLLFEAIGTGWNIEVFQPVSDESGLEVLIRDRIEAFESEYSRFRKGTVPDRATIPGTYPLQPDALLMLELYWDLYKLTGGAVTPLIGGVLEDAGYDAEYSLEPKKVQQVPQLTEVLKIVDRSLVVTAPVRLDFGAIGKGYLVDIVSELIEDAGYSSYCVEAGGDMRIRGQYMGVGLENPDNAEEVVGLAHIENKSIAGSSGSKRKWAKYTHIMNPHTLASAQNLKAVWVVATTAMLADALTTALYFTEASSLPFEFEYAMLTNDGALHCSKGFPADYFIPSVYE